MQQIKLKLIAFIVLGGALATLIGFTLHCYSWRPGHITDHCGTTPWLTKQFEALELRRMVLMYDEETELEKYLKELAKDPSNCHAMEQVAQLYLNLQQWDKAVSSYESTVQKCPKDARSSFWLGVTYYITGRTELGLRKMEAAIRLAADQGDKEMEMSLRDELRFFLEKARKNELPKIRSGQP